MQEILDLTSKHLVSTVMINSVLFMGHYQFVVRLLTGMVSSTKMQNSIVVKREYSSFVPKYERYEKRTNKYAAHCPPCFKINVGDKVRIAECRPLSKTVSFVVVEKI